MRYFVTGGAGFIGSHLVDRLAEMGDVTVYDNLSTGGKEYIAHHLGREGFRLVEADLLDFDTLRKAVADHDVVFHLSASNDIMGGPENRNLDLHQGTLATSHVLEAMLSNGIKQMVYSSSATVYGAARQLPTPEGYAPLLPVSLYGASKLACEGLISAYCHLFGFQAWIFRFGNVSGSRATHGVILDFINKLRRDPSQLEILGDGNQRRPFFMVQDCVDGMLHGLRHAHQQVNLFNLGCDTITDVNTVARIAVEEMGLDGVGFKYSGGPLGFLGDVPDVSLGVEKMARLGWRARYSSDQAVRQAVREMLAITEAPPVEGLPELLKDGI